MAGIGSVSVTSATPVGINQYDVSVNFDIAFDWGGWNSYGASYSIGCDGQSQSGSATFSVGSGGGGWVWTDIGTKTFRVTMPTSGKSKVIGISGYISTGISPPSISASGSYTLPARTWQWKVSYNANGGTGAPGNQTKTQGQTLKLSATKPTRTGYIFQGWATSASGGVSYQPGGNYTSNAAITLYAVWKAETYSVTYDANTGTGAPEGQTKTYGVTLKLSTTIPTKTNYNFLGWTTSPSSTTVNYAPGDDYTENKPITLYAVWELAYLAPRIMNVTVDRCNSSGILMDEGTYAKVMFNWETDKKAQGGSITVTDKTSGSSAGEYQLDIGSVTSGNIDMIIGGWPSEEYDIDHEYLVEIMVYDSMGNSIVTRVIPPLAYIIDFLAGGDGVAFGKPSTEKKLVDSAWSMNTDRDLTVGGIIYDRFGKAIQNGLAPNINTTIEDPDVTLEHLIVTNKNTPMGTGEYMYVETRFFNNKSITANRMQVAYPYDADGSQYHRQYAGGKWSAWRRHVNADEPYIKAMTVQRDHGDKDVSTPNIIYINNVVSDTSNGKLKSDGKGVIVGSGIKKVIASLNVFGYNKGNDYCWFALGLERNGIRSEIVRGIHSGRTEYHSVSIPERIVDVKEGDKLILLKIVGADNTISIRGQDTWMTVKIAE